METEFEKNKRKYENRSKSGYFYNDPNDDNLIIRSWLFGRNRINIAHPQFRKSLLYFGIIVISGIIIMELINWMF